MPKPDNTLNTEALAATIRELEESNATLAQRVGELSADVEARDAALAQRDHGIDQLNRQIEELAHRCDASAREVEGLHDELRRRASGAPLALDITALLDLHRISGEERYLATARRLGDELAAQHDD
ncbi:MAG: hypothetical protein Q8S73_43030 [Deltaproteobacteria bacterium]|nr:hypothetical protein [Myxococcales bacterium]MDP3220937.1 hypothetical protein [Deltaproteobacteria bacterium]